MEIIIALLFVTCLAAYVFVSFQKGDADSVDYDELVRPGGGEFRVKGLAEIFSDGGSAVRETLSAILGPTGTAKVYVPKVAPEKKPRDKEADLLRRYGLVGRFTKRQREARKERALRAGVPFYELRREVRG